MPERGWDPYLKFPYTRLRDLGFGPEIQDMPSGQAGQVLAEIALAAINTASTPTESAESLRSYTRKTRRKRTETEAPPKS